MLYDVSSNAQDDIFDCKVYSFSSFFHCFTLDRHPSPGMILIQVGSNDLGSTKGFELVHDIECDLLRLHVLLPDVKIATA
jgi:hypothetical protein